MFFLKAAYCRMFQAAFRIALPFLPYREPKILHSCGDISSVLKDEGIKSVIIITDKGIAENGLCAPVEAAVKRSGTKCTVFDQTNPNPTVQNAESAFKLYQKNNCDGIIAIGGGSSIDCAKALGARIAYPKKSLNDMKGILKIRRRLVPLIAIPTTAGTGSEVTLAALVTDSEHNAKYALMSFPLIPRYAVLDASLTYSLPQSLTFTTGMDALTHATEAYIGRSSTKETRRLALEAVKLIFENIESACTDGHCREARENMLSAAYKAGVAFSKSYVGYIHAVAHSLGGMYGTPHGLANTVIMPYVLSAYGKSVHKKLFRLAAAAGVADETDSFARGAQKYINAIKTLNKRAGIPDKISGIRKKDIDILASRAEKEANPLYPVPRLMTKNELEQIYYKIADWSDKNDRA